MNIRLVTGPAIVAGLALSSVIQAAAPDVTGLRADIYSRTAIELFWDRIPNTTLNYEVLRDDGMVELTDGTSFYDSTRDPGDITQYTVTAIDLDGMRSSAATVTVGSFDQSSLQVLHLRGDTYSSTSAEIFWIRIPNRDLSYEIMRDDGVTNFTHGDSYYDDSRTPDITNSYTVTVIDEQGVRGLPNTLTLAPFGFESTISRPATGLRASVYSSTSAEIHWDRVLNRALRYEILRDDGLTNITNGTSYYDNKRLPGAANTYIITTIDEEGNRSSGVSIVVPSN